MNHITAIIKHHLRHIQTFVVIFRRLRPVNYLLVRIQFTNLYFQFNI